MSRAGLFQIWNLWKKWLLLLLKTRLTEILPSIKLSVRKENLLALKAGKQERRIKQNKQMLNLLSKTKQTKLIVIVRM